MGIKAISEICLWKVCAWIIGKATWGDTFLSPDSTERDDSYKLSTERATYSGHQVQCHLLYIYWQLWEKKTLNNFIFYCRSITSPFTFLNIRTSDLFVQNVNTDLYRLIQYRCGLQHTEIFEFFCFDIMSVIYIVNKACRAIQQKSNPQHRTTADIHNATNSKTISIYHQYGNL